LKLQLTETYEVWLGKVREALLSINMPMEEWQATWRFDFEGEYKAGVDAADAALSANRFWWSEQNKSLRQNCQAAPDCWLPRGHQGDCQPVAAKRHGTLRDESGDYVKVEFPDPATGIGEWMWVRVSRCDEEKQVVFGTLENEPVGDYAGKIELRSELAVSYAQIKEHKKPTEFKTN